MDSIFDQWEKDPFFPAAEEVQNSTDRMESAFREWVQDRKQDAHSNELRRDLQTALGTAKWQLEAFEKAVGDESSSQANDTTARHNQFIGAIRGQICKVEDSMKETGFKWGKRSLSWVQLNKGERDELALFIIGEGSGTKLSANLRSLETKPGNSLDDPSSLTAGVPPKGRNDGCRKWNYAAIMDLSLKGVSGTSRHDDRNHNVGKSERAMNGHRRTASANAEFGDWKIAVSDLENDVRRPLVDVSPKVSSFAGLNRNNEPSSELKWPKSGLKILNDMDCHQAENGFDIQPHPLCRAMHACYEKGNHCLDFCGIKHGIYNNKQLYEWLGTLQRQLQRSHYHIQYKAQFQVAVLLITVICMVVLFMMHVI